ncbi:MAG: response regulator [Bacteroidota bacterium]|nr:MAG: response regulator [Bacteroidota bacterium]
MENEKIKILYVDDEVGNLVGFKSTFRQLYDIKTAVSAKEGMEILDANPGIEIIITDQRMPEMTGVEFLTAIKDKHTEPIRILLTGYTDFSALVEAINKGQIYRYLQKPWNEDEIKVVVNQAYEIFDLRRKNRELMKSLERANEQLEFLLRQKLIS